MKGVREGMATGLLKTGRQLDQSIGADPRISFCGDPLQSQLPIKNQWSCRHGCDQGASRRQGARLVKQHGFQTRRGLHGIPSPEQEARTGGQAQSDGDGGGGGQPQGARASDHQNGNGQLQRQGQGGKGDGCHAMAPMATGTLGREHPRPEPGAPSPPEQKSGGCQEQNSQAEASGHGIGQALDRRLAGLGLADHLDDAGEGTMGPGPQHLQLQGSLLIEAARWQFATWFHPQRQIFAGQRGAIHSRATVPNDAIDGHPVAGQESQPISRAQGPDPHRPGRAAIDHQQG